MKVYTLYFLTILLCLPALVSSQDLPYITDQEVPDSIASIDYLVLRKRFFKFSNDLPANVDSLTVEHYAKYLITTAHQKDLKADFAKFYDSLSDFRGGDIEILDYAIDYTVNIELSDIYQRFKLWKNSHVVLIKLKTSFLQQKLKK